MYTPIHFAAQELLPKLLYDVHGAAGLAYMDDRVLWTLDSLRMALKRPITVNNWHLGGQFGQRGFRTDMLQGARYSQHRFGRAADFDITGMPAEDFRKLIRAGAYGKELQYVTRCEDDTNWVHLDCSGLPRYPGTEITFFKP